MNAVEVLVGVLSVRLRGKKYAILLAVASVTVVMIGCAIISLCSPGVLNLRLPPFIATDNPPSSYQEVYQAYLRIHDGDTRDAVHRALADAWYHTQCNPFGPPGQSSRPYIVDVFLYGPRDRERVDILIVDFERRPSDEEWVVSTYGFFERDERPPGYLECIPDDVFDNTLPIPTPFS